MFNHILLATDGSEHALWATRTATTLAKHFGSALTLVNVYRPSSLSEPYGEPHNLTEFSYIKMRQDEVLCVAGHIAEKAGVAYQTRRELGNPVNKIVETASLAGADLIILGCRGLGDARSFLLGSVSSGVLHHAHCPVLIVRGLHEYAFENLFHNILLASDGSDCALKAAAAGAALASKFASHLTILNVFELPSYMMPDGVMFGWGLDDSTVGAIQDRAICDTGKVVEDQGIRYQHREEIGYAAAEIMRVAEQDSSSLIVLGSRGLGGIKEILLGSVSDRVAHHACCPVLVVK